MNVRGYAHTAAGWFGREADLRSVAWEQFRAATDPEAAEASWEHLSRSHYFSVAKAQALLGYAPRHTPEQAILESVRWLVDHGELTVPTPLKA